MKYSIVVAVYNRPSEMEELLDSLTQQTYGNFQVVVVEDGSTDTSEDVCRRYASLLDIAYHSKPNSGPGLSRNYGCERAAGDIFIFLDSDCMVPPSWLESIDSAMSRPDTSLDAFGGPDREHPHFSPLQKAISYAMTSFLTTGGIRGGAVRTGGAYHPRSFNMGITRAVFERTKGFAPMRFGEDIDLSMRIYEAGFRVGLITDAWVYHKRRTDLKKFFKQVFNSGMARINLGLRHPGTTKLTHMFPAAFTVYCLTAFFYALTIPHGYWALILLAFYKVLILADATIRNRSLTVGILSVVTSFVQLIGYGLGFMNGLVRRHILGRPEGHAFGETYYK